MLLVSCIAMLMKIFVCCTIFLYSLVLFKANNIIIVNVNIVIFVTNAILSLLL
jgi:hypothetical protein